ncbi:MAG: hypothetical protein IK955_04205 [Clostridia bacterium]|nr:hypothetical protein [Clostridia bacterium]
MKKTLKKRTFISAIAMLVVSAIVLTSSTFAWFSMAKRVEVETMELNITSPDGVQLSANANAFTTMLTLADIKGESTARWAAYEGNENNFPELLSPSSSALFVDNSLPVFYSGSINDAGRINATKVDSDVGSGYVVFDLFVKVGQDQKVYWNESTITCEDNADVVSAMRMAVINCGTVAAKSEAAAILGVVPQNALQNRVVMYEPESTNHTEASGYADGATVPDVYIDAPFANRTPTGNGSNIMQEAQYSSTAVGIRALDSNKAENAYFNAVSGINRIRVYLWMEGNDVDCENSVAGASIDFNLVFTIV